MTTGITLRVEYFAVFLFIAVLSQRVTPVSSGVATFIQNSNGWTAVEGSNVTLDCLIPGGADDKKDCSRIGFTKNGTLFGESPRFFFSGPTFQSGTNAITCTMVILRIEREDAGRYGCCSVDSSTRTCLDHPKQKLTVMPLTTTAAPSLKPTTGAATSTLKLTPDFTEESHEFEIDIVHKPIESDKISSRGTQTMENLGHSKGQTKVNHTIIWPVISLVTVAALVILLGTCYVKKKRNRNGERIPECGQETPMQCPNEK